MASAVSNPITVTDRALAKIKALMGNPVDPMYLRVAIVGGGCSGMSYKLDFVGHGTLSDKDTHCSFDGVNVVIDSKSILFLKGLELDHSDGLDGVGFTFNNPNAKRSCGCGSSFST
jgi:iron-sulfur cluster assembly protein